MSIALEICRIAEERLGAAALPSVTEIGVAVGDDAGVDAGSLVFCLEALLSAPPFAGAGAAVRRTAGDALRLDYVEVDDGRPED